MTYFFAAEMIFKLIGFGPRDYLRDMFNIFDGLIVILSITELIVRTANPTEGSSKGALTAFRAVRLLRIFKLVRSWTSLRVLLKTMWRTLLDIKNFLVLLLIFIFVFALVGREFYAHRVKFLPDGAAMKNLALGESKRLSFDGFADAMVLVFVILTNENWNYIMYDHIRTNDGPTAVAYFFTLQIFGNFVLLKLFLAILINNFSTSSQKVKAEQAHKKRDPLAEFIPKFKQKMFRICCFCFKPKELPLPKDVPKLATEQTKKDITHTSIVSEANNMSDDMAARAQPGPQNASLVGIRQPSSKWNLVSARRAAFLPNPIAAAQPNLRARGTVFSPLRAAAAFGTNRRESIMMSPFGIPPTKDTSRPSRRTGLVNPQANQGSILNQLSAIGVNLEKYGVIKRPSFITEVPYPEGQEPPKQEDSKEVEDGIRINTNNFQTSQPPETFQEESSDDEYDEDEDDEEDDNKEKRKENEEYMERLEEQDKTEKKHGILTRFKKKKERLEITGKAIYCFPPKSNVRIFCSEVVRHKRFDSLVIVFIAISSASLALDKPLADPAGLQKIMIRAIDSVLTLVFFAEALMKIVAYGFLFNGKHSYLRNYWNILDFFVVTSGLMAYNDSVSDAFATLRILRVIRVLRPLRLISRNEGLRVVIDSIFASLPAIFNLLVVNGIFFLVFGIFCINYFKGSLHYCDKSHINIEFHDLITSRAFCLDYGGDWVNKDHHFDNIGRAIASLFAIATLDSWSPVMFDGVDARGISFEPVQNYNRYWMFFFVGFVVMGAFFIVNLFAGVVVDVFNREKDKIGGSALLTQEQNDWIRVQLSIVKIKPKVKISPPTNPKLRKLFKIVSSKHFDNVINALIVVNLIFFTMYWNRQSAGTRTALDVFNNIFLAAFTLEATLKIATHGRAYFQEEWNVFDIIILIITITSTLLDTFDIIKIGKSTSVIRSLRVGRLLRLIRKAKSLRVIFITLVSTLPAMANIGALLMLIVFVYAVLGMNLFGYLKPQDFIGSNANFNSFGLSFMTLLRVSTGESWTFLMSDCARELGPGFVCYEISNYQEYVEKGLMGCGNALSYAYFISFQLIFTMILLNLFIAVILKAFEETSKSESFMIPDHNIDQFVERWKKKDHEGKGFMPIEAIEDFFTALEPALGWKGKVMSRADKFYFLNMLNLPMYRFAGTNQKYYYFYDIALMTARKVIAENYFTNDLDPKIRNESVRQIEARKMFRFKKAVRKKEIILLKFSSAHHGAALLISRFYNHYKSQRDNPDGDKPQKKAPEKPPTLFQKISRSISSLGAKLSLHAIPDAKDDSERLSSRKSSKRSSYKGSIVISSKRGSLAGTLRDSRRNSQKPYAYNSRPSVLASDTKAQGPYPFGVDDMNSSAIQLLNQSGVQAPRDYESSNQTSSMNRSVEEQQIEEKGLNESTDFNFEKQIVQSRKGSVIQNFSQPNSQRTSIQAAAQFAQKDARQPSFTHRNDSKRTSTTRQNESHKHLPIDTMSNSNTKNEERSKGTAAPELGYDDQTIRPDESAEEKQTEKLVRQSTQSSRTPSKMHSRSNSINHQPHHNLDNDIVHPSGFYLRRENDTPRSSQPQNVLVNDQWTPLADNVSHVNKVSDVQNVGPTDILDDLEALKIHHPNQIPEINNPSSQPTHITPALRESMSSILEKRVSVPQSASRQFWEGAVAPLEKTSQYKDSRIPSSRHYDLPRQGRQDPAPRMLTDGDASGDPRRGSQFSREQSPYGPQNSNAFLLSDVNPHPLDIRTPQAESTQPKPSQFRHNKAESPQDILSQVKRELSSQLASQTLSPHSKKAKIIPMAQLPASYLNRTPTTSGRNYPEAGKTNYGNEQGSNNKLPHATKANNLFDHPSSQCSTIHRGQSRNKPDLIDDLRRGMHGHPLLRGNNPSQEPPSKRQLPLKYPHSSDSSSAQLAQYNEESRERPVIKAPERLDSRDERHSSKRKRGVNLEQGQTNVQERRTPRGDHLLNDPSPNQGAEFETQRKRLNNTRSLEPRQSGPSNIDKRSQNDSMRPDHREPKKVLLNSMLNGHPLLKNDAARPNLKSNPHSRTNTSSNPIETQLDHLNLAKKFNLKPGQLPFDSLRQAHLEAKGDILDTLKVGPQNDYTPLEGRFNKYHLFPHLLSNPILYSSAQGNINRAPFSPASYQTYRNNSNQPSRHN